MTLCSKMSICLIEKLITQNFPNSASHETRFVAIKFEWVEVSKSKFRAVASGGARGQSPPKASKQFFKTLKLKSKARGGQLAQILRRYVHRQNQRKCHFLPGGGLLKIGGIRYFFLDQKIFSN